MRKLILASFSPRRKELLGRLNIPFIVKGSNVDETINESLSFEERLIDLAYSKAKAVFDENQDAVVIGCDTTVALDEKILGKPVDYEDAYKMLMSFSDRPQRVYSSLCIMDRNKTIKKLTYSDVYFKPLTKEMVEEYLSYNEWQDKAGAYGIQGKAIDLIDHYEGDINVIIGFPLSTVEEILKTEFDF